MRASVYSNNRSGFTLIEFCVAVLIMMVGLLGLLQAVNMATQHNLGNLLRNEAISVADELATMIKTYAQTTGTAQMLFNTTTFATSIITSGAPQTGDVTLYSGSPSQYDSIQPGTSVANLITRKTRGGFCNYSVVRSTSAAGANSKEIDIRVSWRYKGNKLNHTISSLITNPNPL